MSLHYTHDVPTQEGVYWVRDFPAIGVQVNIVRARWPVTNPGGPMSFWPIGCAGPVALLLGRAQFAGPIEEPTE